MKLKIAIILSVIILLGIGSVLFVIHQKQSSNNVSTGPAVDDISPAARKSLESLVNYADQLPDIAPDIKENIFVLWYRKNINGNLKNYVGVATGTETSGFHLIKEVPLAGTFDSLMSVYFVDFNNDHLDDIYVWFSTNLSSTDNDGIVLIQNQPGEFVVAGQALADLFQYTTGPGVPPKFEDVDGDGSPEVVITNIPDFSFHGDNNKKITKILKLKGEEFFLMKETPVTNN
jgi:hypothetical protein